MGQQYERAGKVLRQKACSAWDFWGLTSAQMPALYPLDVIPAFIAGNHRDAV
jgi:hypothetical protein